MLKIDPIFQKHIDIMRGLQEDMKADLEKLFNQLNLDDVLRNPEAELSIFAEGASDAIIKKYVTKFIAEGVRFADEVKGTKRLIQETKEAA